MLGHFLIYGFVGQLVFTFLQWNIAANTHGHAEASGSMDKQFMLLIVPLAFAVGGLLKARESPRSWTGHPLIIGLVTLAGSALALFNLFVWMLTGFAGYC